jgi:hypothetical protein
MGADRPRRTILSACLVLVLTGLALPAISAAKPTVTLAARAVPIPKNLLEPTGPKWPRTGNRAGAGVELEAEFTITGSEDFGLPAALRRVVFYLPRGTSIHTAGFAKCRPKLSGWTHAGPPCPSRSFASVPGEQRELMNFSGTGAHAAATQGAFFPAGGGLGFWSHITSGPLGGRGYNTGGLTPAGGAYGYKLTENLPYQTVMNTSVGITTVALDFTLGAAYMKGSKLVSLVTMPKACPAGGLPVKAELSFGDGAEPSWETVAVISKEPCTVAKPTAAQRAPARTGRSAAKHRHKAHRCVLETRWNEDGDGVSIQTGDTKDVTALVKELVPRAAQSELWKLAALVTVHNPHVVVCSASISTTIITPNGAKIKTVPVRVGPHGGLSSSATLPAGSFSPEVQVKARRT